MQLEITMEFRHGLRAEWWGAKWLNNEEHLDSTAEHYCDRDRHWGRMKIWNFQNGFVALEDKHKKKEQRQNGRQEAGIASALRVGAYKSSWEKDNTLKIVQENLNLKKKKKKGILKTYWPYPPAVHQLRAIKQFWNKFSFDHSMEGINRRYHSVIWKWYGQEQNKGMVQCVTSLWATVRPQLFPIAIYLPV